MNAVSLGVMTSGYESSTPVVQMVTGTAGATNSSGTTYHEATMQVNGVDVYMGAAAKDSSQGTISNVASCCFDIQLVSSIPEQASIEMHEEIVNGTTVTKYRIINPSQFSAVRTFTL